jgi:hypothetical protein
VGHQSQRLLTFLTAMFYISRCQALKGPVRWSTRPLAQSIRPLSQTTTLRVFLRPTPCLRQEVPVPSFRDKVGPLEYSDSYYKKVGKPRISNQVFVSSCYFLSNVLALKNFSEVRSCWVNSGRLFRCR